MKRAEDKLKELFKKNLRKHGKEPAGYCSMCHLPWHLCNCFAPKKDKNNE